jgi:hypothetical protein
LGEREGHCEETVTLVPYATPQAEQSPQPRQSPTVSEY